MGRNKLVEILKVLANQKRLEILMLLTESCLTASEVAEKLKMDLSTAFRYLNQLTKSGILKVVRTKEGERYDIASDKILRVLQDLLDCTEDTSKSQKNTVLQVTNLENLPQSERTLDVRGEVCPIPELRFREQIERLEPGKVLMVIVDYPISKERILGYCRKYGYKVWTFDRGVESIICVQKNGELTSAEHSETQP